MFKVKKRTISLQRDFNNCFIPLESTPFWGTVDYH